ncbi:MAG TPA: hypothetical protein VHN98_05350 [Acidimicrobiales bacterium]|nr:hypothetical protein [Acidimicrobiales bacterium]
MTDHKGNTPEEMQERLDHLQERIDDDRADLRKDLGSSERHFIDSGSEEPVDDTIAPG